MRRFASTALTCGAYQWRASSVPEYHAILVERLEVVAHLAVRPRQIAIPAGDEQFRVRIVSLRHIEETVESLHLEGEIRLLFLRYESGVGEYQWDIVPKSSGAISPLSNAYL